MSFKSVDEIHNFDFQDAQLFKFKANDDGISFELESLIIEPENSQNENFTKSYAATTRVRLLDGKLLSAVKDGYKRYDADNKLVENVEDTYIENDQMKFILKNADGPFLYAMDACPESEEGNYLYKISVEFPSKEQYDLTGGISYQFKVSFTKAIFEWDRYMNKVSM